jgi:hypothetical protein
MASTVLATCVFLFISSTSASVTEEEAVELSKEAPEAQELLHQHPEAFPVTLQDTFNETSCWVVDWWTEEQIERGLQYPNVRVWISTDDGSILFSGIPREPADYPIPPLSSQDSFLGSQELILVAVAGIALFIVVVLIWRR